MVAGYCLTHVPDSPQTDELVAVYRRLRTLPLVEVRRICRAVVANAD
jgi:hypothetical protein